ncbi:MAG: glycosyltransferase family 4 protein [Kiritimatiellia bacterium]|jgi:glycosyltransferase involved in cell wall biosynthesis
MIVGVNALFMIPGEVGGSETYLRRTLAAAAKAHPGHEFVVFANDENRDSLARELMAFQNVTLVDMRVRATSRARRIHCEQTTLPRVIEANRVDVLWNPGNMAPFRIRCPQATTIHDMQYVHFPEDFTRLSLLAMKFFTPLAMKHSDTVITISEFSRQEIVRYTQTPFDKIVVTMEAADERFSEPLPGDFIAERVTALLRSGEPYILVVANTYPHKSVETAVRAFSEVCAEIPHRLVLLGKPRRGEGAVAAALAEAPEPERVLRLHHLDQKDLAALYQGADLFVLPSKYEGFGLPVLEAMSAGVPVLTTREASIPEVGGDAVAYARAGSPAAFAAEIRRLLALDAPSRAAMVAKARERAAGFSWEATARATVAALEALHTPGRSGERSEP